MEQGQAQTSSLIQVPAQTVDFKPKADRSFKLVFETRELSGDDVKLLVDTFQGEGWLVFKPNSQGVLQGEIPEEAAEAGMKSPSLRLRNRLYVLYKQKDIKVDFESFYRTYIERKIEEIDEQLESGDNNVK